MTDSKAMEAAARALADRSGFALVGDWDAQMQHDQRMIDDAQVAIAAYLAAMEAEGFVMVPVGIIEDLCSELEAEVRDRWGYDKRLAHKIDRDMLTVNEARAMIAARPKG